MGVLDTSIKTKSSNFFEPKAVKLQEVNESPVLPFKDQFLRDFRLNDVINQVSTFEISTLQIDYEAPIELDFYKFLMGVFSKEYQNNLFIYAAICVATQWADKNRYGVDQNGNINYRDPNRMRQWSINHAIALLLMLPINERIPLLITLYKGNKENFINFAHFQKRVQNIARDLTLLLTELKNRSISLEC